ncbi:MAG TPA: protein kinase [Anaerolineales bacterium]|nr:protein kinase [Anaerolineales bacterium]
MPLTPGSVLRERYRIDGKLGKGGMGAVYLAFDQTLQLRVAVKENLNLNPESERQFLREATLLASLRHPHLPRVTDHFILEGQQYLVMDFIEGVDLHARAADSPPTIPEVLGWAQELGSALSYLHTRQPPIIHRDVKPSNIKLQPDGRVVLVDFGIAKVFEQTQTSTGARGLTPGFSPPEQYGGARTDARSDEFSLAATLYSLLTGKSPADSIERMLNKEQLVPPRQLNPRLPAHVDAALMRALSIDQEERFPDVASFMSALRGELQAETVRAPAARPARASRLPLIALGGAGVLGLLLIGGGAAIGLGVFGDGEGSRGTPTPAEIAAIATTPALASPPPPATITPEPSATPEPTPTPTLAPLLGGGGRIAFISDREDGRTLQVWTMLPDGSDPVQLTFGPGDKSQPEWSPDGRRLLFVAPGGLDGFGNDLRRDIFVLAPGSGQPPQNLTQSPGDDYDPAWAPNGTAIAFTSTRNNNTELVHMMFIECPAVPDPCVPQKPQAITMTGTFAPESDPTWSPDSGQLAVVAKIRGAPGRIYVGGFMGGGVQFDRSDRILGAAGLAWSPGTGTLLVFTWVQPGSNEIYIVPLDNSRQTERLTTSIGNKEPGWSPDGNYLIFTSTRDEQPEIYRMTASGGDQVNLTQNPARDSQPDWQPVLP